eukprot:TRINITY_DN6044_c0_g1_i5.p1 TRINITY_DN6044_c0_g1~~TRINITY_DN6044_c0_g1_i5.p1  ORF type:complete len:235 (+),score=50.74 TRINITY_DN6044_c0_g1_i5:119-823(+)
MAMARALQRTLASFSLRRSIFCSSFVRQNSLACYSSFSWSWKVTKEGEGTFCSQKLDKELFFLKQFQRGFAKGKKSKADENSMDFVSPDIGPTVKSTASSNMEAALDALSRELAKIRTGRANAGMLDHIIIEASGSRTPLSRMAAVSVLDSQTLNVLPYDSSAIKEIERAIIASPLALNPRVDGDRLIVPIPKSTKEHIQAMTKLITKASEDVKQSIRRARQRVSRRIHKCQFE